MNLDMEMFHQAFFEEAADLLADLEGRLLLLEETPRDPELLGAIFRCAHSIKGGSATFGFADIAHFTHGLETLLDRVRNGQTAVDSTLTNLLLASLDQMKALLFVARGEAASAPDSAPLTARIEAMIAGDSVPAAASLAAESEPVNALTTKAKILDFSLPFGITISFSRRDTIRFGREATRCCCLSASLTCARSFRWSATPPPCPLSPTLTRKSATCAGIWNCEPTRSRTRF